MSTENELTPGIPPHLHTMSYPDLTTTIQLNNAVSLLEKASTYGNYNENQLIYRTLVLTIRVFLKGYSD